MACGGSEEVEYITTDSGLKYRDIVVGHGKTATTGDAVNVHYVGKLEDGTKFDSSVEDSLSHFPSEEAWSFKAGMKESHP